MIASFAPAQTSSALVWLTSIAALAAGLGSLASAVVTYFVFRAAIDPHVIVYAKFDPMRPTLVLLVIENIGKGVAEDVRFESSRPLFYAALGLPGDRVQPPERFAGGAFVTGIPSLEPGGKREYLWGQPGGILDALGNGQITVTAHFHGRPLAPFQRTSHTVVSRIDYRSFHEAEWPDPTQQVRKQTKALEKLSKAIERIGG